MATSSSASGEVESSKPENHFLTTHWSAVLLAGRQDTPSAHVALEQLCQTYWYPLYAYVRRRGYSAHDAQDLTQSFFVSLMQRQSLSKADPERGRFRSFILTSMNFFLANEWTKTQAQKRGGGQPSAISLDLVSAEGRFDLEPADPMTPDKAFDKEWAAALLEKVLNQLEEEYRRENKADVFKALKETLAGSRDSQPYAQLAANLNMNEGAVKTAVHRLRKRYRHLVESEIANTVASPQDIADEMRHLFKATAG